MIRAVLFDLDGTLMDTSEGIFHTANYAVAKLGMEPVYDESQLRKFVGPPLKDCFRIVYGYEDEALLEDCVRVYRQEYEKVGMHLCRLYDGIVSTIGSLRSMGIRTGVCTLKYEKLSRMIFDEKGITGLFDTIHGTNHEGTISKADCIRMACNDLSLDPECVLMVGDTVNDLDGARQAGVRFVAALWGFGFSAGTVVDYGQTVSRPEEIIGIVKES